VRLIIQISNPDLKKLESSAPYCQEIGEGRLSIHIYSSAKPKLQIVDICDNMDIATYGPLIPRAALFCRDLYPATVSKIWGKMGCPVE